MTTGVKENGLKTMMTMKWPFGIFYDERS